MQFLWFMPVAGIVAMVVYAVLALVWLGRRRIRMNRPALGILIIFWTACLIAVGYLISLELTAGVWP